MEDSDPEAFKAMKAKKRKFFHALNSEQSTLHANVVTRNRFQILDEIMDDSMNGELPSHSTPSKADLKQPTIPKKASHIPPITIIGHTKPQVLEMCKEKNLTEYHVKHTSTGINLYCKTADDFVSMRNAIKDSKTVQYFTHDLATEKEYKVVLKGLLDCDEADLKPELEKHKIMPKNIRQIVPKKQKFQGQVLYVLSFPINTVKMSILRQCKYLCMVNVEWDHYIPKKYGPTQCYNCQEFGHGSRNCGKPTKCPACAGPHILDKCEALDNPNFARKCANCEGSHAAGSSECPKRLEYQRIQENISLKNSLKNRSAFHHQSHPEPAARQRLPQNRPKYEQIRHNASQAGKMSYSAALVGTRPLSSNPNLLSNDILIQITMELIPLLQNCRTIEDQLRVVITIANKFASTNRSDSLDQASPPRP